MLSTSSSDKNTPISQLPRVYLLQCLREALLTKLELLDRGVYMVVCSESKHVVVSSAGNDETGL